MDAIREGIDLIKWLDSEIDGLPIGKDERVRFVAGCFDMALEHQKAIVLLTTESLNGSALSLVRLIFEAYIRGLWLLRCASANQVEKYKEGKLDRYFSELITDVEAIDGYEAGTLSAAKKTSWAIMNDFTHTGFAQVLRRNKPDSIEPNYDPAEITAAVHFANSIALLSAIEISFLAKNEELSLRLLKRVKQMHQNNPNE